MVKGTPNNDRVSCRKGSWAPPALAPGEPWDAPARWPASNAVIAAKVGGSPSRTCKVAGGRMLLQDGRHQMGYYKMVIAWAASRWKSHGLCHHGHGKPHLQDGRRYDAPARWQASKTRKETVLGHAEYLSRSKQYPPRRITRKRKRMIQAAASSSM